MFRREKILTPDGRAAWVPVVSGNAFRGVLRRIGEELTAGILNYEDKLPIPAAHLLTNGGRPGKTNRPMTDQQERELKELLPIVGVFGGSASGRILSGRLTVGKVLPEFCELEHLLHRPPQSTLRPAILSMSEEPFAHLDDHNSTAPAAPEPTDEENRGRARRNERTSPLGIFRVQTLPAGTRLQAWAQLTNATDNEVSFFCDVLNAFAERGHLGGRSAVGHGSITATVTPTVLRGDESTVLALLDKFGATAGGGTWVARGHSTHEQVVDALVGFGFTPERVEEVADKVLANPSVDWAAQLAKKRRSAMKALGNLT
uniref:RAMP superfamily CRISPR-associated protein n=1 Tax=Mycolicibacterium sp. CBMA 213 TaxID=1968788 RepID=UPI0031FE91C8